MDLMIEHDATGRILRSGIQQSGLELYTHPGSGGEIKLFTMDDPSEAYSALATGDFYFEEATGDLVRRPVLLGDFAASMIADGLDEIVIDLPDGTKVTIEGQTVTVEGGVGLVITTDMPGVIDIQIEPPFPYQSVTVEITAHAP